jgi:hypothetical protein
VVGGRLATFPSWSLSVSPEGERSIPRTPDARHRLAGIRFFLHGWWPSVYRWPLLPFSGAFRPSSGHLQALIRAVIVKDFPVVKDLPRYGRVLF